MNGKILQESPLFFNNLEYQSHNVPCQNFFLNTKKVPHQRDSQFIDQLPHVCMHTGTLKLKWRNHFRPLEWLRIFNVLLEIAYFW